MTVRWPCLFIAVRVGAGVTFFWTGRSLRGETHSVLWHGCLN